MSWRQDEEEEEGDEYVFFPPQLPPRHRREVMPGLLTLTLSPAPAFYRPASASS